MIGNWSTWPIVVLLGVATLASGILLTALLVRTPIDKAAVAECLLVIVLGLEGMLAAVELRSSRSGNFVAAYEILMRDLEKPNLRLGRWLLRTLRSQNVPPDQKKWELPAGWPEAEAANAVQAARDAYDGFDIAGIMVLHSKIPDLVNVFVAEYQDSIIACWEQGVPFFRRRVLELQPAGQPLSRQYVRDELYQCFSVLYVMAKHRKNKGLRTYPFYSIRERMAFFRRSAYWEKEARMERERLVAERLAQPTLISTLVRPSSIPS